jgi:hypothetical protein
MPLRIPSPRDRGRVVIIAGFVFFLVVAVVLPIGAVCLITNPENGSR